jgi:hypothetical protein
MPKHLTKTWYTTNAVPEEGVAGHVSATIPDRAFEQGQIVHVDWSQSGWVEVTFLVEGTSPIPSPERVTHNG